MAKRVILRAIRHSTRRFSPGQEKELAAASTPEQLKEWQKRGLIEGDWGVEVEEEGVQSPLMGYPADALEPIAARIGGSLGFEREEGEPPLQFLERFASDCERITSRLGEHFGALESERDTAILARDEALAHWEQAVAENDKLKADLDELKVFVEGTKADAEKPDAKADAKSKAKS